MRFVGGTSRRGRPIDIGELEKSIRTICETHTIVLAYLFGSYATGTPGILSDIDIAVLAREPLDWRVLVRIAGDLAGLLEDEAIGLVDLAHAPDHLAHRVLRDGMCLYAKDLPTRIDYEVAVEMRYGDAEPLRREYLRALERRIEDGTFGH